MPIASANPFPSMLYVEQGSTPANPSSGQQKLFVRSSDHVLCTVDSSGTVTPLSGSLTNPMTGVGDLIRGGASGAPTRLAPSAAGKILTDGGAGVTPAWGQGPLTTDGDLLVGATAGTPTRLAKGAAGGRLGLHNGVVAWDSGTSFPASPATNDVYHRTDVLGGIDCIYDGTRWLGPLVVMGIGGTDSVNGFTANGTTPARWPNFGADFDLWIVEFHINTFVNGTNTGSAFWTLTAGKNNLTNTATSLGTADTSGDTASNWTAHKITVGAAIANSGFPGAFQINATKTSTPAALFLTASMVFRLIVT